MTRVVNPIIRGVAQGAASSGLATFLVNGILVKCQVARDLTVAAGDVCMIVQTPGIWLAVGRVYPSAPATVDTPGVPDPRPSSVTGTLVCSPAETRSYRSGGWRTDSDDVVQGISGTAGNSTGCAFYGTKPGSLNGATITAATVRIKRPVRSGNATGQQVTLYLVTETLRPVGAPTLSSSTAGPTLTWGQESVFTFPTAWAQAMAGGTAGGLAVFTTSGDPLVVLSGRGDYGPAFTISLTWTR